MNDLRCVWEIEANLAEGPSCRVARENALYWVDIFKQNVHRLSLANDAKKTWTFDTAVTSLAVRAQGGFVGTVTDGFAFIDFETSTFTPITLPEAHMPENRFNDGKVDGYGQFLGRHNGQRGQKCKRFPLLFT